jgi:hypothetical protein
MTTFEEELYDWDQENLDVVELEQVEEAKVFISEALDCLYGDKPLDHLEFALEEACSYLDIPFPKGKLKIEKPSNPYFEFGVVMSKHQARILSRHKTEGIYEV